jgi:hypothetical protein
MLLRASLQQQQWVLPAVRYRGAVAAVVVVGVHVAERGGNFVVDAVTDDGRSFEGRCSQR